MTFNSNDEIYNKFNKNDWDTVEKNKLSDLDKAVIIKLNEYVECESDNKNTLSIKLLPCGVSDLLIDALMNKKKSHNILNEKSITDIINDSKDNNKKNSSIIKNFIDTYNTFIKNINIKNLYTINKLPSGILNLKILEYIILFHCISLSNYTNDIVDINVDMVYHYIACKTIIKKCSNYDSLNYFNTKKIIKINDNILNNVNYVIDKIDKLYRIDICTVYDLHPIALSINEYNYLPDNNITLRLSQIKLLDSIKNNYNKKNTLIILKSSTGSGKTTSIVPIALYLKEYKSKLLEKYNKNKKNYASEIKKLNNLYVIFCCNLKQVKIQVANLCYNSNIDFSIAHTEIVYYNEEGAKVHGKKTNIYNEEVIITKSNKYDKINTSSIIITDPYTVKKLKEQNLNYDDCILFLDEPTNNLENNKIITRDNCNVMLNMTKTTILSSTTLPNETSKTIKYVYDKMKNIHGSNSEILTIEDNNVIIGHTVFSMKGDVIIPSQDINTINTVKNNIFLSKFYTPIIYKLLNKMINRDSEIINMENINNNYVKDSCIKTIQEKSNEIISDNFRSFNQSIDMNLLGCKQAYKFNNMTLIVFKDDVVNKTLNMFKNILSVFGTDKYKDMLKKKEQENKIYQHKVKIAENQLTKKTKKKSNTCDDDKKDNYYKVSSDDTQNEYNNIISSKPKLNFPEELMINSEKHIKKHSKEEIKHAKVYNIDDINLDYNESDELKILLLCGIGVYLPSLNSMYTSIVLDLSSKGLLNYVVSDHNISYGTNHPFSNVIITEEFIKNNNINTLFQLFGRVGRLGRSYHAYVYVPDTFKDVLMNYILSDDLFSYEDNVLYKTILKCEGTII